MIALQERENFLAVAENPRAIARLNSCGRLQISEFPRTFRTASLAVLRHAACPRWGPEDDMFSLTHILVPHDFSETSAAAAKYATELARTTRARVTFLHVGNSAQAAFDAEFPIGLEDAREDAIRERLLKIVTPQEQIELAPQFVVRPGAPATEIVRYAEEQGVDLIVMGTHGRGFLGHVVMGSVAERVVRTASCPVLTVRNPNRGVTVPEEIAASEITA
jgi:nucleotide-binding universal stress UspA family protein